MNDRMTIANKVDTVNENHCNMERILNFTASIKLRSKMKHVSLIYQLIGPYPFDGLPLIIIRGSPAGVVLHIN